MVKKKGKREWERENKIDRRKERKLIQTSENYIMTAVLRSRKVRVAVEPIHNGTTECRVVQKVASGQYGQMMCVNNIVIVCMVCHYCSKWCMFDSFNQWIIESRQATTTTESNSNSNICMYVCIYTHTHISIDIGKFLSLNSVIFNSITVARITKFWWPLRLAINKTN